MKFSNTSVVSTPEILKRKLGGELIVPITVVFGDNVTEIKAGTPIASTGAVATTTSGTSNAVGVLLNDVTTDDPNGALVKAFACVNTANCPKVSNNSVITDAVKTALPLIVFE